MAFYDHYINPERGALDSDQYSETAQPATGQTIYAGGVISVDTSGEYINGVPAGKMPYFAMDNGDDPDVDDTNNYFATAGVLALAGVAPYQIATTEYVDGPSYVPGMLLMAGTVGDAGKITERTAGNDVIGVIGVTAEIEKRIANVTFDTLVFWLCWRPVLS